ncbi:MAG: anti-sigma factor [Elainellaceae cyanobacterium]
MTGSISSEQLQSLIAGYVLYDLSPEEAATLEQLAAEDPAIAQELQLMQETLEMAYAPAEVEPPAPLKASILSAYEATQSSTASSLTSSPTPSPVPVKRGWSWGKSIGAIAALLIAGLGISNYMLWRSLQTAQSPSQNEPLMVSLNPTEEESAASATVVIHPDHREATLQVENLPPLAEGQVYALWTVLQPDAPFTVDTKNAILTGVFTVDDQGTESEQILLPPVYQDQQWVKAIAITVEAADAPQRHESSPILIVML